MCTILKSPDPTFNNCTSRTESTEGLDIFSLEKYLLKGEAGKMSLWQFFSIYISASVSQIIKTFVCSTPIITPQ